MDAASTPAAEKLYDIAIAGETNLDLILYGLPELMPVERELLASGFVATLGGSSSILAHNLALLGSRVAFTTLLGSDELGAIALSRLRASGVDLSRVELRDGCSTGVTLLLPHGARRHILTHLGIMEDLTAADLDLAYLTRARHFHISSLFLQTGLQSGLPELFTTLRRHGLTLSLDTNDDPSGEWASGLDSLLDLIDILLPNEDELLRIARQPSLELALDALADRVPIVVVKRGAHGAVVQQGHQRTVLQPLTVEPVDTIGAGDSFNAGFLHAFVAGRDPVSAARLGTVTGALSTQRPGGTEAFLDAALLASYLALDLPSEPTAVVPAPHQKV